MSKPMFARPAAGSWRLLFRSSPHPRSGRKPARQGPEFDQAFHVRAQCSSYQDAVKAEEAQVPREPQEDDPFYGGRF